MVYNINCSTFVIGFSLFNFEFLYSSFPRFINFFKTTFYFLLNLLFLKQKNSFILNKLTNWRILKQLNSNTLAKTTNNLKGENLTDSEIKKLIGEDVRLLPYKIEIAPIDPKRWKQEQHPWHIIRSSPWPFFIGYTTPWVVMFFTFRILHADWYASIANYNGPILWGNTEKLYFNGLNEHSESIVNLFKQLWTLLNNQAPYTLFLNIGDWSSFTVYQYLVDLGLIENHGYIWVTLMKWVMTGIHMLMIFGNWLVAVVYFYISFCILTIYTFVQILEFMYPSKESDLIFPYGFVEGSNGYLWIVLEELNKRVPNFIPEWLLEFAMTYNGYAEYGLGTYNQYLPRPGYETYSPFEFDNGVIGPDVPQLLDWDQWKLYFFFIIYSVAACSLFIGGRAYSVIFEGPAHDFPLNESIKSQVEFWDNILSFGPEALKIGFVFVMLPILVFMNAWNIFLFAKVAAFKHMLYLRSAVGVPIVSTLLTILSIIIWIFIHIMSISFTTLAFLFKIYFMPPLGLLSDTFFWWYEVICIFVWIISIWMWWRDLIIEATYLGKHTKAVQNNLLIGFTLFVLSEFMVFFGIFWSYFYYKISPTPAIGAVWPPKGLKPPIADGIALANTATLLYSGKIVNISLKAVRAKMRPALLKSLIYTSVLGALFLGLQLVEYIITPFTISDSVYGSIFYFTTGTHGMHVLIGLIFIIVCLIRAYFHHFRADHHVGLICAIAYWHFVDIIWIFVYFFYYVWV